MTPPFLPSLPPRAPTISPQQVATAFAVPVRVGGTFTDTKPSQVRRIIAGRLAESKATIPHQYAVMDCQLDALMKLRNGLKEAGVTLSVNDMVIKAAAKALRDVPEANCYYDGKSDTIVPNATVDVSVAVATEGGLITPIVKGADTLGLLAINERVKDLAGRARANKLKPDEFQGGSFTISNLGMFGIDEFSAVINPPQACILAVGKGEKKVLAAPLGSPFSLDDEVVVTGDGSKTCPEPIVATVMTVMLSSDARVVDAAISAQFLQVFRHYIQNPTLLVA
ncbi:MAG: 2-oxo acid dehydrogenase subunit E2 [Aquabacterium sp.]|nr:2-oxo acid dehydrogenase subunit E2 [Aquabacterium sp.]MDO9002616.1 2-oxo acid dehydrogenase subunit E2 [Aquabacterium sp.]